MTETNLRRLGPALAITQNGLQRILTHKAVIFLLFLSWAPVVILGMGFFAMGTQVTKRSVDPKEIHTSRKVPQLALPAEPHMIFSQLLGREQTKKVIDRYLDDIMPLFWRISFYQFVWMESWVLLLIMLAAGPHLVTPDFRSRSLPLYFSKPISRMDYALGKAGVLVALSSLSFLLPAVVLYIISFFFFPSSNYIHLSSGIFFKLVLVFIVFCILSTSIVLWIGSSCKAKWTALIALIGFTIGMDFSVGYLSHLKEIYPGTIRIEKSIDLIPITGVLNDLSCILTDVNSDLEKLDNFIRIVWIEDAASGELGKLGDMKKLGSGNPAWKVWVAGFLYAAIPLSLFWFNMRRASR